MRCYYKLISEVGFIRVGSLAGIGPEQFFLRCVCVRGGAGHITTDDWCVCECGVSENVMIGLGRVHLYPLPTRG